MFQEMINGSIAVLTRPSVATFEEHERDNLGWALIYVAIGAVINAILSAIAVVVRPQPTPAELSQLEGQFGDMPMADLAALSTVGVGFSVVLTLVIALIGFLIYLALVYGLGRAFGGTGSFGELGYDIALFYTPLTIFTSLINIVAIGPLACLTAIIGLAATIYNIYLTYLGIQSGMNLESGKAIVVMLLVFLIFLLIACVFALAIGALIAGLAAAAQ